MCTALLPTFAAVDSGLEHTTFLPNMDSVGVASLKDHVPTLWGVLSVGPDLAVQQPLDFCDKFIPQRCCHTPSSLK